MIDEAVGWLRDSASPREDKTLPNERLRLYEGGQGSHLSVSLSSEHPTVEHNMYKTEYLDCITGW